LLSIYSVQFSVYLWNIYYSRIIPAILIKSYRPDPVLHFHQNNLKPEKSNSFLKGQRSQ